MGMYTEIRIDLTLKEDAPREVERTLRSMLEDIETRYFGAFHPLFATERWAYMLTCGSAYFDEEPHHEGAGGT